MNAVLVALNLRVIHGSPPLVSRRAAIVVKWRRRELELTLVR